MKHIKKIILILSLILLVIGVTKGEVFQVFYKGMMICLECIGIG